MEIFKDFLKKLTSGENKKFAKNLALVALPVSAQTLIQSALGIVDQIMIGQLGEISVAAVSLANRPCFVMIYTLGGISAASSIFSSQYEGSGDREKHANVMKATLCGCFFIVLPFFLLSIFAPSQILGIFTKDAAVISAGKNYLFINAISYAPLAVSLSSSAVLRSTGFSKVTLFAGLLSVTVNTFLNAVLIFGLFFFPRMGAEGAAAATVVSRFAECLALCIFMKKKNHPAFFLRALKSKNSASFSKLFFFTSLPAIGNELLWALGDAGYTAIYGNMGTEKLASVTLTFPVQGLTIGFFSGLAAASGILIGSELGAKNFHQAKKNAYKFMAVSAAGSAAMTIFLLSISPVYVSSFKVSEEVSSASQKILAVFSFYLWNGR